ncbi:glycosyltransferase [Streptomyces lunaelactis]|uniref:glycosyltransferase family 2 protein n=1 Tax=Streptomyces lunaelactis TaxID=1535768 RepID=UPI0015853A2E|nr:glycosyltransferase [Streptomyces lunaelactis]NUK61258.1 glycosyltransferase [Streptomyces lunaelactis]NUK75077.1 glycosyltransferase [Streptomyces lunaelactis]NUK78724.1 glycosyltransferase [Streptomyces lunaelactis]
MSATTAAFVPAHPPEFPRHVVTAVLVSHDGARWLPDALAGLLGQERPVQNVIAADTGSADDSARLVTEALGAERVLHLARRTGFGTAVEEAARTAGVLTPDELPYLKRPSGWDPVSRTWRDDAYDMPELPHGEPVQWLWLLHDDSAPEPGALAELLRVADSDEYAAIVGPKLRGWYDRKQLLEAGVSIANSGRRWTGLDRREQDQGQHDQTRSVLSVSSAGMLIRRDVFDQLGGFDRRLPLMRDDVDLCWRAHAAGHRVLIAPDAVMRHAEASARERRTVDCAGRSVTSPHRVDKAGAVYTLLANARGAALPYVLLRIVIGTLLRTLAYLVGKVPGQAVDEVMGLFGTLLRPERIIAGRRRRAREGGAVEAGELRPLFPPPGATIRATVEQVAGHIGGGSDADSGGSRHGVVESGPGGDDADFLEIEQFARLKKIARKPGPVLFALLLLVSVVACRGLFGSGALAGGALLPAPADVSDLWSRYADNWHPLGTGGTQTAPPYLAVLAGLSTLFLGSTGFALTVLLVCSVPLAGLTAYFASRPIVESRLLRAWASIAYAFLPAATGALATGRLGTAVLAILLPLIARAGVAAHGLRSSGSGRGSWRATWAYALLLTLAMAFTPIVWPVALVLGLAVLVLRRDDITAYGLRFLAAVGTPLLILAPWSLTLLTGPSAFFREAGLEFGAGSASALDLLGISPGGPKAAGGILLIGIVLAALAALLRGERQFAIRASWAVALVGLIFAAIANGSGWAGPATLVYGIALLAAAVLGGEGGRSRVAAQNFGWRQPVAVLIALAAGIAPLLAAANWMLTGAAGPLERRDPVQVPAFVAEESDTRDQPRTLVLGGSSAAKVSYTLVRGSGGRLGDAELAEAGGSDARLDKIVANLVAGSGADQTSELSGFAVRYVLVRDGVPRQTSRVLDATPGLSRLSQLDGSALWRVDRQVARATIVSGKGEPLPVASDAVEAHAKIPAGASGRVLRIADRADDGWQATLDGRVLKKTAVDGWAQGFELPAEGGRLDLTYDDPATHTGWIWAQGALALVLLVLALPGRRREIDDDLPEEEIAVPAQPVEGEGRRARRLRAQAEAGSETELEPEAGVAPQAAAFVEPDVFGQQQDEQQPTPYAAVPQQHGEWDAQAYADAGYATPYSNEQQYQYGGDQQQQYSADEQYQQQPYQADPYQADPYQPAPYPDGQYGDGQQYQEGQYDPYAYGQQAGQQTGQQAGQPYADGSETDQHPGHPGNTSRGESE